MAIYRDLFFNNVEGFISSCFPVLRSLTDESDWRALVRDFYARHVSHSPLFSDIPAEFLSYLEQEKPADLNPTWPFLLELAHYEWLELVAQIATEDLPARDTAVAINSDTVVRLSPLAVAQAYQFPVHRIGPDWQPAQPPAEPTTLVVYRNRHDQVQFLALNALSYQLLNTLEEAGPSAAGTLLTALASSLQVSPDKLVPAGLNALQDFIQRDIVLALP